MLNTKSIAMKSLLEELNQFAVDTRQVYGGVEEVSSGRGKGHSCISKQVETGEEFVITDDDGKDRSVFRPDSGGECPIWG